MRLSFNPPDDEGLRIASALEDSDYQFKTQWALNDNHNLRVTLAGAQDFAEAEFTDLADVVQKNPDYAGEAATAIVGVRENPYFPGRYLPV